MSEIDNNSPYAIEVNNLTKNYAIYSGDVKRALGTLGFKVDHRNFTALDKVSYNFEKGEVTAVLGRNGSGKSTLLKLITGVTPPDSGEIIKYGRVSAMLELRSGFNKELTGEENIYYKALTMGIPRSEIEKIKEDIISFADIGIHITQPYRTYSSGMKARLGFAVAVSINPDILIVDEALSVGDRVFKMKCIEKMNEFREAGKTILFVSHSMRTIQAFCTRAIWLNQGKLMAQGDVGDVVVQYEEFLKEERAKAREKAKKKAEDDEDEGIILSKSDILRTRRANFLNDSGEISDTFVYGHPMRVEFDYEVVRSINSLSASITIENSEGIKVFSSDTQAGHLDGSVGWHKGVVQFGKLPLISGRYNMTIELWDTNSSLARRTCTNREFTVVQSEFVGTGIVYLDHEVSNEDDG